MLATFTPVKPILIIGADGLIGRALVDIFESSGRSVWQTTRRRDEAKDKSIFLDVSLDSTHWSIPSVPFDVAIICAAVTSLEQCRIEPKKSAQINVAGTVALAKYLIRNNTFVVFISSNLVFDGTRPYAKSTDPVSPKTEYGRQKAQAEQELLQLGNKVAVVRFAKIVSPDMQLVKGWIRDLRIGRVIHPFSDMLLSPVPLWFAARVLQCVAERRISGITQVSAMQDVSYETVARYLASKLGADPNLVEPILYKRSEHSLPQLHTTLDISRLQSELKMEPPDIWETIDSCN